MAIEELLAVLRPPHSPVETGNPKDRDPIERSLGIELPSDFWEYGRYFGTGKIILDNFDFRIFNPFSVVYKDCVDSECNTLRTLKSSKWGATDIPFAVFPDRPGLFAWGNDVNGDTMFWLTEGKADDWPVVVWPEGGNSSEFERFDMSLTSFLARIFKREIICKMWKDADCFFEPGSFKFEAALLRSGYPYMR